MDTNQNQEETNPNPGAGAPPPSGNPPPANNPPPHSFLDRLPEDLRKEDSLKLFKDEAGLAKGFVDLKKMLGSMPRIPNDKSAPEEWNKFYDLMGRPAKADEYDMARSEKLPKEVLEAEKEAFGKFAAKAHALGLTKNQLKGLIGTYDELTTEGIARETKAAELRAAEQAQKTEAKLRAKFGNQYESTMAKADLAYKQLNPNGDLTNAEIFAKLADYIGEDRIGTGSTAQEYTDLEKGIEDGYTKLKGMREGTKERDQQIEKINMMIRRKSELKASFS